MNTPEGRKRVIWLAAIGGVLLISLLFISLMAPSPHPGESSLVLDPAPATAAAQSSLTGNPTSTPVAGESAGFSLGGGQAFSLAWRLLLVAIIIAVSIVGLRWWGRRAQGPRSTTGFLRVIDTLAISNGRTIHLVALGDRVIAVGATAQQLTYLNELSDDEASRVLAAAPKPSDQPLASFAAELFAQMRGSRRDESQPWSGREITIGEER